LVHLTSANDGAAWKPTERDRARIRELSAMYGGLFASGDFAYLITADDDMSS
jgi:hypothetical protein